MGQDFIPIVPAGFDIAGTFGGVTTAVGQGGVPRIRYQIPRAPIQGKGVAAWAMRQVMKSGAGEEVALGSLHTRIGFALMMVGKEPEPGLTERLSPDKPTGFVLGRYKDTNTDELKYGAMALVKSKPGLIEILVTECTTEQGARDLIGAAMAPYL
jgi:hypothetical protein